eukprot:831486-Pyramimonas_sp.AAC.1
MVELHGSEGGISEFAFSRGLSSEGNLDKTTCVDLGDPSVQRAVDPVSYTHLRAHETGAYL